MLGVSAATVKRWADAAALPYERTTGGHRRFTPEALERFVAERTRGGTIGVDRWVAALVTARAPFAIEAMLLDERSRRSSWVEVAEALSEVLDEIGERWERGTLVVLDEHVASARLSRALARTADAMPVRAGAPVALLATPEGEQHTVGLSLVELCLREAAWATIWAGASVPTQDLVGMALSGRVQAVLLSATVSAPAETLEQVMEALGSALGPRHVPLVVGGRGRWPDDPRATLLRTFSELHAWTSALDLTGRRGGVEPMAERRAPSP